MLIFCFVMAFVGVLYIYICILSLTYEIAFFVIYMYWLSFTKYKIFISSSIIIFIVMIIIIIITIITNIILLAIKIGLWFLENVMKVNCSHLLIFGLNLFLRF